MNRRDFTRGLMSLGLVPALPIAVAAPAGAAAAANASLKASHMYFMGWYTARMNETCSPDMLVSELGVNPDVAHEIFGKLVQERAVLAPDAFGVSRTVDPFSNSIGRISQPAVKPDVIEKLKARAKVRLEKADPGELPGAEGAPEVADARDDPPEAEAEGGSFQT